MARAAQDLKNNKPELIVIIRAFQKDFQPRDPVLGWAYSHYVPFPGLANAGSYNLFVRRGGPLEGRLLAVKKS